MCRERACLLYECTYNKTQMLVQLLTLSLGLFVGLSLGALGGGGSTLAVPVLVFVAGLEAQDATTASLIVVGLAAAFGVFGHYRNGNVRIGAGLAFGAAGVAGSRLGTQWNQALPEQVLLVSFAALILVVAARMYQSARCKPMERVGTASTAAGAADAAGLGSETLLVATKPAPVGHRPLSTGLVVKLAAAATVVGVLTGLFGVGGGFAVVPALTLLLGFQAKEAVGTSLIVIAINASVALLMRGSDISVDWTVVAPFLGTVVVGVLVGSQVANRLDADRLTRSFAVMLGCVAAFTAFNALF